MAACPSCGRALASGARTCVYCAHGTTFQRREELKVPEGTLKRRGGFRWGRLLVGLAIAGAVFVYFTHPGAREAVDGLIASLRSRF